MKFGSGLCPFFRGTTSFLVPRRFLIYVLAAFSASCRFFRSTTGESFSAAAARRCPLPAIGSETRVPSPRTSEVPVKSCSRRGQRAVTFAVAIDHGSSRKPLLVSSGTIGSSAAGIRAGMFVLKNWEWTSAGRPLHCFVE